MWHTALITFGVIAVLGGVGCLLYLYFLAQEFKH